MRRLLCVSALVPLLAAPIACGRAHDGVETRQAELDFETGNVKGTISWKGNPLDASEARDLYLFESGSVSTWTNDTSYLLEGVPEGTRTVGLYVNSETGEHVLIQGDRQFVLVDRDAAGNPVGIQGEGNPQRWKEILDSDRGNWLLVAHNHPGNADASRIGFARGR